ncbi:MAG TPA: hypothetical protein VGI10_17405 [Polyangiaceae bacterium]
MTNRCLGAALVLGLLTLPTACSKKQDQAVATGGYQPAQTAPGAPTAQSGVPQAQPGTPTPQPSATAPAPTPVPQATDPAVAAAIQPVLTQLGASQVVAGSKPLGTAVVGNVGPGQTLESQLMLQPNKCYSVVAAGAPTITELSVQLVAVTILPGLAPVLATDQDTGPTAVLGKKPNCYKWALPVPVAAKIVVQASGGQGPAAAQAYEK